MEKTTEALNNYLKTVKVKYLDFQTNGIKYFNDYSRVPKITFLVPFNHHQIIIRKQLLLVLVFL